MSRFKTSGQRKAVMAKLNSPTVIRTGTILIERNGKTTRINPATIRISMKSNASKCAKAVSKEIRKLVKRKEFPTRKQNVAVAFSKVRKAKPECKPFITR